MPQQQLKITLPLKCDKIPHRGCGSDRPGLLDKSHNVKEVPAVLQPHISLDDWIDFCDQWVESNENSKQRKRAMGGILAGIVIIGVSIGLFANHRVYRIYWAFGVCALLFGGMMLVCYCGNTWRRTKGIKQESRRDVACEALSKKLGYKVCIYYRNTSRVYKSSRGVTGRKQNHSMEYYYFEIWVNPSGCGYDDQYFQFLAPMLEVPDDTTMIEDDHVEESAAEPSWANNLVAPPSSPRDGATTNTLQSSQSPV